MADDSVNSEVSAQQEDENVNNTSCEKTANSNGEATAAENQGLSKRQKKKLLKQQKWEEERELRK